MCNSTGESVDLTNVSNDKISEEDKNLEKISGKTFLNFLATAYHLNETIEGATKDNSGSSISECGNLTNGELFATLLSVEEKCVLDVMKREVFDEFRSSDSVGDDDFKEKKSTLALPTVGSSTPFILPLPAPAASSSTCGLPAVTTVADSVSRQSEHSDPDYTSEGLPSLSVFKSGGEFSLRVKQKDNQKFRHEGIHKKLMKSVSMSESKDPSDMISPPLKSSDGVHSIDDEKMRVKLITKDDFSVETIVKNKLGDVLQEGVLDSVLPYLSIKYRQVTNPGLQQTSRKLSSISEAKKNNEKNGNLSVHTSSRESRRKNYIEDNSKISKGDIEVEIHVCDEAKNLKKDFKCSQKLLVSKMGYFAEVTTGQKLEDMDISVHCDINIFEWLMKWVKKDQHLDVSSAIPDSAISIPSSSNSSPVLDTSNVIPILVSASFLQMDPLLETCLQYCKINMNDILKSPANLSCLNDSILTRLSNMFSNVDIEALRDKKDKIRSRLFCKLIVSLTQPDSDPSRGHFSSFVNIFQCIHCRKMVLPNISIATPCIESRLRICPSGKIIFLHDRDPDWTISDYVENIKGELKCWRRVYWRMWATCHFLFCTVCHSYYSLCNFSKCFYHPEPPQFYSMEQQRSSTYPVGRYSCCGIKAYRYECVRQPKRGCKTKKHIPQINDEGLSSEIMKLFDMHHSLIFSSPSPACENISRGKPSASDKKIEDDQGFMSFYDENTEWREGIRFPLIPDQNDRGLLMQFLDMTRDYDEGKGGSLLSRPDKLVQKNDNDVNTSDTSTYTTSTVSSWHDDSNEDISDPDEGDDAIYDGTGLTSSGSRHQLDRHNKSMSYVYNRYINKNKKNRSGLRKTQWVKKFSTRYNQDNQRDYEERAFQSINSMLSHRITNTNSSSSNLSDQLSNLLDDVTNMATDSTVLTRNSMGQPHRYSSDVIIARSLNPYSPFSSYCRALGLLNSSRIIPSRSYFCNSHTPLGGTYVKIESEWKEAHNVPANMSIFTNNTMTNSSSRTRSSRVKTRPR